MVDFDKIKVGDNVAVLTAYRKNGTFKFLNWSRDTEEYFKRSNPDCDYIDESFKVIGISHSNRQIYVDVPSHVKPMIGWLFTKDHIVRQKIDEYEPNIIGKYTFFIYEEAVRGVNVIGANKSSMAMNGINKHKGASCSRCKEHNLWAEANQPDGTFKCYACRFNPYR